MFDEFSTIVPDNRGGTQEASCGKKREICKMTCVQRPGLRQKIPRAPCKPPPIVIYSL